jgi:hypothetical protein
MSGTGDGSILYTLSFYPPLVTALPECGRLLSCGYRLQSLLHASDDYSLYENALSQEEKQEAGNKREQ